MATKSILLIDHEGSVREVLQTCLSDVGGWHVTAIASVREGLEQLPLGRPDAILLETFTSEIDGLLFVEQLKQYSRDQSVPIVLIADRANWFTLQQLHYMGFAGAISKPFDPATLPSHIAELLHWTSTQD
jgi:CheY-like chemotaxis protein